MTPGVHEALQRFAVSAPEAAAPALTRLRDDLMAAPGSPADCIHGVVAALRDDPALRDAFAGALGNLLARVRHRFLYADTGVLEPLNFGRSLRYRLGAKLLPHVADPKLLRDLVGTLFSDAGAVAWVCDVPADRWSEWIGLMLDAPVFAAGAAKAGRECDAAMAMLAARAAGLAVDPDRVRYDHAVRGAQASNEGDVLDLSAAVKDWVAARAADSSESPRELLRRLAAAVEEVDGLHGAAPTHGTSLALTHSLHAAHQSLERLRELVLIRAAANTQERAQRAAELFVELVAAQRTEHSLGEVFSHVADEVSQRITEHASQAGEHYVTDDRPQWWAMLRAAAGAGVIVACMALVKILIARGHFAPLWSTLAICLNYGLGFVLIHLLHFTVATKQPAMTATLLAERLGNEEATPAGAARLAELIVRTVRTQIVAIVGNVALAVPTATAIYFIWRAATDVVLVPEPKVRQLIDELHPWASWALLHAAVAGVCLFATGVISGYYDNLCIYGRVAERLAHHPGLLRLLGPARAARLAAYIENNLGALIGNFVFGFLLGGVGFIGVLTGLPIDIRHVAFASANTAYALSALGQRMTDSDIVFTVSGDLLIGVVNVAVSYGLAFATAFRARNVRYERAQLVMRLVLKRLLRRPLDFVWPPTGSRATDGVDPTTRRDRG